MATHDRVGGDVFEDPKVEMPFQASAARMMRRVRAATDQLERHVVPIYRIDADGDVDLEGSGIFVTLDSRYFIATAAHVLRSCRYGIAVPAASGLLAAVPSAPIVSKALRPRGKGFTPPDIGVVELPCSEAVEYGTERFWSLDRIVGAPIEIGPTLLLAVGYPIRDGVSDPRTGVLAPKITMFMSGPEDERAYQLSGVDVRSHLLMRFRKRVISTGRSVGAPPSYRGMSGCGVWPFDVRKEPGPDYPEFLAGLLVERPAGFGAAFLVTRGWVLRGFIERFVE